MKEVFQFKSVLTLLFSTLLFISCNNDDDNNNNNNDGDDLIATIVEAAQNTPSLSSLVAALAKADENADSDLIGTLSGNGSFTVFAPTNDAFNSLLAGLEGFSSLDDFDTDEERALLGWILQYHVVAGTAAASTDLSDGQIIGTVQGENVTVSINGDVFIQDATDDDAQVTTADVETGNGIVHIINKVLLPQAVIDALNTPDPTIVDLAIATADLSILVDALTAAGLVTTLQGDGPFTVFAPTNAAFASFLADNNFASLDDIPVDVLTDVLLNHVVSGTNLSTDLATGYVSSLSTAGADDRNLSLLIDTASGVTINGVSNVATPDVVASNGVVHIVDAVIGLPTIVDHAVANSDLSSLVGALTADGNTTFTDLLSSSDDSFTVFAPVNSAFTAFTNPNGNDINNVLSYHVIPGTAAFSDELMNMYVSTAATNTDGDALSQYINIDSGVSINGASNVAAADIVATNGVVHAVDAVIDLPTVVTFAVADMTFAPLVSALTEGTPNTDFVATLTGDGPFTVFAPTADAFQALLDGNADWNSVTDIEEGLLTSVLLHHVANGNVRSGDLTDGIMPTTLEGDAITINLPGTGDNIADVTDGNGATGIGIVVVDVQANNGVIHVVNQVLLPDPTN